jgi:hypothetical protein
MLRIAKPGAILLAMGGTRTYHRLACAIEDAGWEVFDMMEWLYGSGFPKSYNVAKGMDKYLKTGNASWNGTGDSVNGALGYSKLQHQQGYRPDDYSNKHQNKSEITTPEAQEWDGWGTALKPAHEPICVAMKPRDGTYVNNALTWGVAGFNIDGARVEITDTTGRASVPSAFKQRKAPNGTKFFQGEAMTGEPNTLYNKEGRWPANVIHDGSDEVLGLFPESSVTGKRKDPMKGYNEPEGGEWFGRHNHNGDEYTDSGSAARFFYCAKASRSERNEGLEGMKYKLKDNAPRDIIEDIQKLL